MKNQFWAGLGSRAVLWKKKFGADYEQLLRPVFLCFHRQKINLNFFWKYCSIWTKKLHRIEVKKVKKVLGSNFYRGKPSFFRAKNFNVSTKTHWSVLCWLLLCPWYPGLHHLWIYFPKPTLRNIPDKTFMENKKLHKLVFQEFSPKLHQNSLEGLNNLGTIEFWRCNMTSLPDGIFENTPSLKEFTWEEHFCQQEKHVLSNHMFRGTKLVNFTYSQQEK